MNVKNFEYTKYQTSDKKKINHIEQIIRAEIINEFKTDKNIYIYDKISVKYNIIEIFVVLLSNTLYNKRQIDITFLIIIKEDYPHGCPLVFCLTEFNKNLDIFDVRNLQRNLVPNWSTNNKISDLIRNLPILIENIDIQVTYHLLPDIGEYHINSLHYDLNDFFLNVNNKFFRTKIINKNNTNDEAIDIYLIVTKSNLIFLKACYEDKKNICKIKYIINIIDIIGLTKYATLNETLKGFSCFQINLDEKSDNKRISDLIICVDSNNLIVNQIKALINERKEKIFKKFKYFERRGKNRINDLEKIIEIKKNLIKNKKDENIFNQIHDLYNKLIEISSNEEGDKFSKYLKDFQDFLGSYDNNMKHQDKKDSVKNNNKIFEFRLE